MTMEGTLLPLPSSFENSKTFYGRSRPSPPPPTPRTCPKIRNFSFSSSSGPFIVLLILPHFFLPQIAAFWLPPVYWVTIFRNGQIEPDRSQHEFIDFSPPDGAYIGYWINNSREHQEAYGHIKASPTSPEHPGSLHFCGQFADSWSNQSRQICGGFRILAHKRGTRQPCPNPFAFVPASLADPFLAIEYLDTQIARIQLDNGQWVFGGARIAERMAFASDPRGGPLLKIYFAGNRQQAHEDRVEILQRSAAFPVEDLLDDSQISHPRPSLPPIPVEEPMTTRTTAATSPITQMTSTSATTMGPAEILQQDEELATTEAIKTTTATVLPLEPQPSDYDDELSGAGIEWGALFTGEGVEETEEGKKQRRASSRHHRRRRRRRHFRARHPKA